ncbi:DUF4276 family protein [Methylomonas sp. DH-1]|uniref:DUF4276 family protein n=1 Tax=Methylomonas sp. (strain DH-1) TaxID=1727196 RepID=UPI000A8CFA52|nr:DUF4276 family protein [Methylomonas sp. DH-1]
MTKKFAVFVEGFTEQEFAIRLLSELAGNHGISFEVQLQHQGKLSFSELRSHQSPTIHVLVANCCNDGQVKSQIKDRYNSLKLAGYSLIVGLRDVYPFTHTEIDKLENSLLIGLPIGDLPIHLHLAIMEIEAWFLEETTHFQRIDNNINTSNLIASGFDTNSMHAYDLPHPAETLAKIYNSVGKGYTKNRRQVQRTIDALSYEELYLTGW